ncbi:MAG: HAMP domain-containing sensor histidine kinase [Bacteroidales bacterium]|nr:HAMP domain-containing sensor histidine kinase [Bacteroidales bacterium]
MSTDQLKGLVLQCDETGQITRLIRNDFNVPSTLLEGKFLTTLSAKGTTPMTLDFILQTKAQGMAMDYPLTLTIDNKTLNLNFTGFFVEKTIWIIGASKASASQIFINELQLINNEQANQIRQLVKLSLTDKTKKKREISDSFIFDELSQLNNDLVNLQRELTKKNAELARLNELKNQFLGMATHDIRNPLSVIMTYADFLLDETKNSLSEEHQNFLKIIFSSAEFLLSLIENLLDITQIESGKLTLNLQRINIVELAQNNIALNNSLAAKKNVKIYLNQSSKNISINVDPPKLEQVLNNLTSNAVKFSHPGSSVQVNIIEKDQSVVFEFEDQGVGIPEDMVDKIFTPFEKASSEGTAGEKTTGLGLSIAKKIIEGHGGTIMVSSKLGVGSKFSFELPKA